jgi:hypothetical protein
MKLDALLSLILSLSLIVACISPGAALDKTPPIRGTYSPLTNDDARHNVQEIRAPEAAVAAPVVIMGAYEAGEVLIYFLIIGGVIVGVAETPKSVSMGQDLYNQILNAWNILQVITDVLYKFVFNEITVTVYKQGSEKFNSYINTIEEDYNDAKDEGVPAKNHDKSDDNHKMPNTYNRYSSLYLFHDATDESNGCPKQLRYYGKDGTPDLDIDLYHGAKENVGLPHTHTWRGSTRGEATKAFDNFINSALWQRCKKYDYYNQKFKE